MICYASLIATSMSLSIFSTVRSRGPRIGGKVNGSRSCSDGERSDSLLSALRELISDLSQEKLKKFKRRVSVGDLLRERVDIAHEYGFGEGTIMYDNVLVLGDVKVGKNVWIGPNVILDGSGGLEIGDNDRGLVDPQSSWLAQGHQ
jgi:hypothetical protein